MASKAAKSITKSQIFQEVSSATGLTRKQVGGVFDSLSEIIKREMGKKGSGVFTIPGLVKLKKVHKPASKAREGVNPFTGQPMTIKAKPARNVVKALALKGLKEMAK